MKIDAHLHSFLDDSSLEPHDALWPRAIMIILQL